MILKEIPKLGLILLESCLESRQLKNIPFSDLLGPPKLLGIYRDLFVNDLGNDNHIFLHMHYALMFACIKWMLFYSRVVFRHVSPSIAQWFASLQWIAFTLYIFSSSLVWIYLFRFSVDFEDDDDDHWTLWWRWRWWFDQNFIRLGFRSRFLWSPTLVRSSPPSSASSLGNIGILSATI